MIPVVDVFAGPGGLGEGFSAYSDTRGRKVFQLVTSIEKEPSAHATLRLRAFRRQFSGRPPAAYDRFLKGEGGWGDLVAHHPREASIADEEARLIELGPGSADLVRELVSASLPRRSNPWVLVGGPPCQAYSLAGRSRNKGNRNYSAEMDGRQTLYIEYLQLLADHAPPVFVMENVKGLLSAELKSQRIFDRILEDLGDPASALARESRRVGRRRPRYEIVALSQRAGFREHDASRFLVRAEEHGVPQRRHRVILVGLRRDVPIGRFAPMVPTETETTVATALAGLPRLRSGLSDTHDSDEEWRSRVLDFRRARWLRSVDEPVRRVVNDVLDELRVPRLSRGRNVHEIGEHEPLLNHTTRGHMRMDLARYLFASSFGRTVGRSPRLTDFPETLLPVHGNVRRALGHGLFSDRFRVQVDGRASTTITSHISKDGHYYIHPDPSQCRSLTVREAARLQTFPDDYFFCGPRTAQYHQVGNAVPPALATRIAELVHRILS